MENRGNLIKSFLSNYDHQFHGQRLSRFRDNAISSLYSNKQTNKFLVPFNFCCSETYLFIDTINNKTTIIMDIPNRQACNNVVTYDVQSKTFRINMLATPDILSNACGVTDLNGPYRSVIFLERFRDDKNFSLLKQNMYIRDRFFWNGDIPETKLITMTKNNDRIDCSHTPAELIAPTLGNDWNDTYSEVFACYTVFRHCIGDDCIIDQMVFDADNAMDRCDVLSCRFNSLQDLRSFEKLYNENIILTNSKLFICLQIEHPDIWKQYQLFDLKIVEDVNHGTLRDSNIKKLRAPDLSVLDPENGSNDSDCSDCSDR